MDAVEAQTVLNWLHSRLGLKISSFMEDLADGILLCKLVNAIEPRSCDFEADAELGTSADMDTLRVSAYLNACSRLGFSPDNLFWPTDLIERNEPDRVLRNLSTLMQLDYSRKPAGKRRKTLRERFGIRRRHRSKDTSDDELHVHSDIAPAGDCTQPSLPDGVASTTELTAITPAEIARTKYAPPASEQALKYSVLPALSIAHVCTQSERMALVTGRTEFLSRASLNRLWRLISDNFRHVRSYALNVN